MTWKFWSKPKHYPKIIALQYVKPHHANDGSTPPMTIVLWRCMCGSCVPEARIMPGTWTKEDLEGPPLMVAAKVVDAMLDAMNKPEEE